MDIEKIIFLTIVIGLSIFSMYRKAKKQRQSSDKNEEVYQDYPEGNIIFENSSPIAIFEHNDTTNLLQNSDISTKNKQKQTHHKNIETPNLILDNSKNTLQNTDLESNTLLLEDFNGTEIQKAFLYSEIFKSIKN
jgi:hypothetical protein